MNDTFDYITRFVVIIFAYCCAVLAAGWFLAAILYSQLGLNDLLRGAFLDAPHDLEQAGFFAAVLVGGSIFAALAGSFSFIPALVVVLVAEMRGWKSSIAYCLTGLAIGLAASSTRLYLSFDDAPAHEAALWQSPLLLAGFASAGVVGGFVYWLIAGRNAGRLLNRPTS